MLNMHKDALFSQSDHGSPVVTICTFLVVALNLFYHLTLPGCRFALRALRTLVEIQSSHTTAPRNAEIPADLATALKLFNITPDVITYTCCPECFALYPPRGQPDPEQGDTDRTFLDEEYSQVQVTNRDPLPFLYDPDMGTDPASDNGGVGMPYPMYCTRKKTEEDGQCSARLLRKNKKSITRRTAGHSSVIEPNNTSFRPIRTYKYQPLTSWLARMFSRSDFERMINSSMESFTHQGNRPFVDDILQSEEVQAFLDEHGEQFLGKKETEARLIFSLFIDWFNPRGNRRAGASISSGVLFMACLNLPPEVRYKRENIYLAGVLPGPKSPSIDEVNHYLEPLIPELLELWLRGVAYSRTALHAEGRLVRGALIPVVADLGAVRKTTGHASHSATYFCSFCQLKKRDINQVDHTKWPRRDCKTFRELAESWRAASSHKERNRIFKAYGVRYSVLLELPYWKPSRFVVLDTMHNLFLGLFQRHCRKIFGMNIAVEEGNIHGEEQEVSEEDLARAVEELRIRNTPHSLKSHLTLQTMRALYEAAHLGDPGKKTKLQMAEELLSQVSYTYPRIG